MVQGQARKLKPPILLIVLLWLLVQVVSMAFNGSELIQLALSDTDDYMRLNQVMNWIQGAQWHDLNSYRLNPPEGVLLHWSRLPDLPLAAVITALTPWIGQQSAIIVAITLVPALLMLALFLALWYGCIAIANREAAEIALFYLAVSVPVMSKLFPGKLDHHGWQLLLLVCMWALLMQACREHWGNRQAVMLGLAMGFSLWVGLEVLPFIALIFALLAVLWIGGQHQGVARFSRTSAISFALTCSLLLPLHLPVSRLMQVSCDTLAINWIVVAWLAAGYFTLLSLIEPRISSRKYHLLTAAVLAIGCVAVIGLAFPNCLSGPFSKMDPFLQQHFLANISEAKSVSYYLQNKPGFFIVLLGFPLLVLTVQLASVQSLWRDPGRLISLTLLFSALLLSFWQVRVSIFAILLAIPLGAAFTAKMRQRVLPLRLGPWYAAGLLIALSPLLFLGINMLMPKPEEKNNNGSAIQSHQLVDLMARRIAEQPGYESGQSGLIAASINLGATILARTTHGVLAAPYHRNQEGLRKAIKLSLTERDDIARKMVLLNEVDFILLGVNRNFNKDSFYHRLAHQETPGWLLQLPITEAPEVLLFQVLKPQNLNQPSQITQHRGAL